MQTSFTQIGEIGNFSIPQSKRVSIRIKVPLGRTKQELAATLERAARELKEKTKANAVNIFAYRPQDKADGSYSYTAGKAVYAPNGNWADIATAEAMQIKIELNDLYFAVATDLAAVNSLVKLKADSKSEKIAISCKYESWQAKDIINYVSEGSEAKVIEIKTEPVGSSELARYQVSIDGNTVVGWVHQWNIQQ